MNQDIEEQVPSPADGARTPGPSKSPSKAARGFATMSPEQLRELSRRGGLAAHKTGNAHRFTREEARVAGRKGGLATHAKDSDRGKP